MKKAVLYLFFTLLLAGNIQANNVQVLFDIRPEVNYVTHLYTLAGLGFSDDEYTAKYGNTLPKAAVDTLQKYKDYLTFGQGEGGMLAVPFFFIVSSESFVNADSLQTVLKSLMADERMTSAPQEVRTAACAIAKVYADNYDDYIKTVYPRVVKDMQERQRQLTQKMQKTSLVCDWERVTGYTWNRGNYHWLLFRAGEKGPSYNNVNDTTNTVYYDQSIDFQLSMFSHEFGIFLMQDSIMPIFQEMKEYTGNLKTERDMTFIPWSAYESLACWYNCKIAGGETEDFRNFDEADVKTFCQIFDRLSATGVNDPAELYRKGITEYLKDEAFLVEGRIPHSCWNNIEGVTKMIGITVV